MRILLGILGVVLVVGVSPTQDIAPKPVASVTQLMRAMVIPASNALFDVARNEPETDEAWGAVKNQAVILAESGNLLLMRQRARDSEVWLSTSRALVEAGEEALKAAEAENAAAVAEAGNQIIEACESCHEKHWIR